MCGRYALTSPDELVQEFGLGELPYGVRPRYNIAPTQEAPVVVGGEARTLKLLRWGLVPSWATDAKGASRLINARAESVHEKPSFREPFAKRRCLVCSDGFYEWKVDGKRRVPHFIHRRDGRLLAFAGIWECFRPEAGEEMLTFSVLTTEANELMRPVHHRMPVILDRTDYERWLDPGIARRDALEDLLAPAPESMLELYEVSSLVSSPANDSIACLRKGPDQQSLF